MDDLKLADLPPEANEAVFVHPTAIVEQGAQLGKGVRVGPFCIVGPKVTLGDFVALESHISIQGRTSLGRRCAVHAFSTLGVTPQDLKFNGEDAELIIGAENSIRQYANISIGTEGGGGKTVIGRRNLIMSFVHIAHDCVIGNNCIFASRSSLAGHVHVDDHVIFGGHAAAHQFVRVGKHAMLGGASVLVQDVPPFITVQGDRAAPVGLNSIGLKRAGYSTAALKDIKAMYRLLYNENLTVDDCIARILEEVEPSKWREEFVDFVKNSERGICR